MKVALSLCDARGRFLYEVRPDLLPPFLSETELELWGYFYEMRNKGKKGR